MLIMVSPTEKYLNQDEPMIPYEVRPITSERQSERRWQIHLNGQHVPYVESLQIINEDMGMRLDYGDLPEGHDGISMRERGGAATIPYMIDSNGQYYVGLVKEKRPKTGEMVTNNIPRGSTD